MVPTYIGDWEGNEVYKIDLDNYLSKYADDTKENKVYAIVEDGSLVKQGSQIGHVEWRTMNATRLDVAQPYHNIRRKERDLPQSTYDEPNADFFAEPTGEIDLDKVLEEAMNGSVVSGINLDDLMETEVSMGDMGI